MAGYLEFPPFPYFMQVLRHFPDCAYFYSKLWSCRNDENKIAIKKLDIGIIFLMSTTKFRNKLINLLEEGLVSFETTPEFYYIELVGFDEEHFNNDDEDEYELA